MPESYSELLKRQYETFPYPYSTPEDTREEPGGIPLIAHYTLGGRYPTHFRSLVAGGGTGNGTLMLARQYAEYGIDGEIVHVDLSSASIGIARERLRYFGLLGKVNVRFIEHDLLKLSKLELGEFDHVNCSGVIHHLPEPAAALEILRDHTKPGGSIFLMVYGTIGRTGVYHLQPVMRLLFGSVEPLQERVAMARRLLKLLPSSNWFKKNSPMMADGPSDANSDAEIYDLLLHSRDRAYTLPELRGLVEQCGLAILTFLEPITYHLETVIPDAELLSSVRNFSLLDKAAITELVAGNIKTHRVLLVKPGVIPAPPDLNTDVIPIIVGELQENRHAVVTIEQLHVEQFGVVYNSGRMRLPQLAADIFHQIDGVRTLNEIYNKLLFAEDGQYNNLSYQEFLSQFAQVYGFLHSGSKMFLRVRE